MKVVRDKITNLYLAYGSNLNQGQMKQRCPAAVAVGTTLLDDHRLVFRGVADVIEAPGRQVPLGIWRITPACEDALDRYEGWPRLYRKKLVRVRLQKSRVLAMMYVMNRDGFAEPSDFYYEVIAEGYDHFELETRYLHEAVQEIDADIARYREEMQKRDRRQREFELEDRAERRKAKKKHVKTYNGKSSPVMQAPVKKFIAADGRQTVARDLGWDEDSLYEDRPKPPPTSNWPAFTPRRGK